MFPTFMSMGSTYLSMMNILEHFHAEALEKGYSPRVFKLKKEILQVGLACNRCPAKINFSRKEGMWKTSKINNVHCHDFSGDSMKTGYLEVHRLLDGYFHYP